MEIVFLSQELEDFYNDKRVKSKHLKSNPQLGKQYRKTIDTLRMLKNIEEIYILNSLNYERLKGNLLGKSSVRINQQYRLIFTEIEDEETLEINVLGIEEISNHYQ